MRKFITVFLSVLLGLQPSMILASELTETQEVLYAPVDSDSFQEDPEEEEIVEEPKEDFEEEIIPEPESPLLTGWNNGHFYNYENGELAIGWLYLDGETYYLNSNGEPYKNQTLVISGKEYCFDSEGRLYRGAVADTPSGLPKFYSLFDGSLLSGLKVYGGTLYLLEGSNVPAVGLQEYNGHLMYYNGDGTFAWDKTVEIGDKQYYFDTNGYGSELIIQPEIQQPVLSEQESYNRQKAREILAWAGTGLEDLYWLTVNSLTYQNDIFTRSMDDYARIGFDTLQGNCFTFASVFYYLASEAGYAARYVHGSVNFYTGASSEHGWVVINEGGKEYIYDPEAEKEIGKGIYHFYRMDPLRPVIGYRFPAGEEPLGGYTIVY